MEGVSLPCRDDARISGDLRMKTIKATGSPIPIRFAEEDEVLLRKLQQLTGLAVSNLIRRSVRYATPRFIDGRVNLLTLQEQSSKGIQL
jgi:hypothetical protein